MKVKKALRKLAEVEDLLTGLIDRYDGSKNGVRELLDTAKSSVARARKSVTVKASSKTAKKPPAKANSSNSKTRVTARGKKAAAVKKQAAVA